MDVESEYHVARAYEGAELTNTFRLPRIDIVLDDPVLGLIGSVEATVQYADGTAESLKTDSEGVVSVSVTHGEYVDIEIESEPISYRLRCFVNVPPISTEEGVWQRLANLGYVGDEQPPAKAPDRDTLETVIEEFQADYDLNPTGILDDETRSQLTEEEESDTLWQSRSSSEGSAEEDWEYGEEPKT